jgi:hypothetical protein
MECLSESEPRVKEFSSLIREINLFEELKRLKMEETAQYFEKQFFINRS